MKKKILIIIAAAVVIVAAVVTTILLVNNSNKTKGIGSSLTKISSDSTLTDENNELKIGTYNINNITSFEDIKKVCENINRYSLDVVCFQELNYDKNDFTLEKIAKEAGFDYYRFFFESGSKSKGGSGIGIISKYALTQSDSVALTKAASKTSNSDIKILSWVTLDFNGTPVEVYTSQLESTNATLRTAQIKEIDSKLSGKTNAVFAGDLQLGSFDEISGLNNITFANTAQQKFRTFYSEDKDAFYSLDNIGITSD
nr:endonuclease/exonuclease/phosphatase family protein [Clostridiales bacterium]